MHRLPIVAITEALLRTKDTPLRLKCRRLRVDDPEDLSLAQGVIAEMFRTLFADPSGVALAAPQVGLLLQIAVISYQDHETGKQQLHALINPQISRYSQETNTAAEICLSVPNLTGEVERANGISVEAYDISGKPMQFNAEGFFARVIQHELDHLQGVLYVDRTTAVLTSVPDYPERRSRPILQKLGLIMEP